jgi:hypothetical protein
MKTKENFRHRRYDYYTTMSQFSVFDTRLRPGRPGFTYRWGAMMGVLLFATSSRPARGLTQPPLQWVPGIKRPEREADHLFTSFAEVNFSWNYTFTPLIRIHSVVLN